MLMLLLERTGAKPDLVNAQLATPLHVACRHNKEAVVKFLIDVIPKGEVGPVVQELRDNLDITPAKPATQRPGNIISTRPHAAVKSLPFSHFIFSWEPAL